MTRYDWNCPRCGGRLTENEGGLALGESARNYSECRRWCDACGIGLSNALRPTFARKDWTAGLWSPSSAHRVREACAERLHGSGAGEKLERLQWETSEDLLTWNVFEHLEREGRLEDFVRYATGRPGNPRADVLYWGWSAPRHVLRGRLESVLSEAFNELPGRRTEPDVIIISDRLLLFVEAKLGSSNPQGPGKAHRYVAASPQAFAGPVTPRHDAHYQLVRNWAIGSALARRDGYEFWLVNLVREGDEVDVQERFRPLLADPARFVRKTWEGIAAEVPSLKLHLGRSTHYFEPAFTSGA